MNKRRLFVSAIYTSPPNSMGGNTKIALEIIKHFSHKYNVTIFTTEPETFKKNVSPGENIKVVIIRYPFKKFSLLTHLQEVKSVTGQLLKYFADDPLTSDDIFFSQSDFAPDVIPIIHLKKKYKFKWIPSLFLFIPDPIQNIIRGYGFPIFKYILYFFYQRYLFNQILKYGDLYLITNDYDRKYFPKEKRRNVYAIYGGVNIEDIEAAKKYPSNQNFDAVFCGRLHPQKGVDRLLKAWALVVSKQPKARLAIIGNGDKNYEKTLKKLAVELNINKSIAWFGYLNGVEKYKIYLASKIFLHSSVYDNNGMVAAEALCTGLPVIMFDLDDLKSIYTANCFKVRKYLTKDYAKQIYILLENKYSKENSFFSNTSRYKYQKIWNWENRMQLLTRFILSN